MKRTIVKTKDGSSSLFVPDLEENFHSTNGAYTESMHVFIGKGLHTLHKNDIKILEIGFGTGLNCILTYKEGVSMQKNIVYHAIELYPITKDEFSQLNFINFVGEAFTKCFNQIFDAPWNVESKISERFVLKKNEGDISTYEYENNYDLIYFDAFAPDKQPELWTKDIFQQMYNSLDTGGVLVTYCAKGVVRRIMQSVGFIVERTDGPPGKREMMVAVKK